MVPKGWIELTQLNGRPLAISVSQIVCVRVPVLGELAPAAKSVVDFANGKLQGVTESFDEIIQKIADSN
jgi:uncharacterized protein YlzI (FlbEa/FlbD family)